MSTDRYWFLSHIESMVEVEVREEIETQLADFWQDCCDPGDWYTPVGVVSPPGRIIGLVPVESQKDHGGDGTHLWAGIPKARRWAWTELLALRAVAQDLELFRDRRDSHQATRRIETLTFEDLLQAIHQEIPERLAQAYRKMAGTRPPRRRDPRRAVWESRSFRISEGYRLLRQADVSPFVDGLASPREYRAFDLHGEGANAIAVVNIHTG
ncbi:MAG: hypothetical protein O7H41_13915 [Planctomycetota bacterium]|nr:hypothetical protein [Planctomycetota bacterium]